MEGSTALLVGAVVCGLAGGTLLLVGRRAQQLGAASSAWPRTTGRVVSSEVARGASHSSIPRITYSYSVAGRDYTSSVVSFRPSNTNFEEADRIVKAYPANGEALISYNPALPSQSVLVPGAKGGLPLIILGAITLLLSLAMLGFFFRL